MSKYRIEAETAEKFEEQVRLAIEKISDGYEKSVAFLAEMGVKGKPFYTPKGAFFHFISENKDSKELTKTIVDSWREFIKPDFSQFEVQ